jgi:hypothetical protein
MEFPSGLSPVSSGRDTLFWAVLSDAAADGKPPARYRRSAGKVMVRRG